MNVQMNFPSVSEKQDTVALTQGNAYITKSAPNYDRELLSIKGGSIAWNQLIENGNFEDTTNWKGQNGHASITVADGVATVTLTSGSWNAYTPAITQTTKVQSVTGHKYAVFAQINIPASTNVYWANSAFGTPYPFGTASLPAGTWNNLETICNATASAVMISYIGINLSPQTAQIGDSFKVRNIHIHDLTQMFGSTIADYIYTLEQNEAGTGVAWFKSLFPNDYYSYDSGSLQSVCTSEHNGYALDSVELRGVPKLTDNQLDYDGDTYDADGSVTRKYGVNTVNGDSAFSMNGATATDSRFFYYPSPTKANGASNMFADLFENGYAGTPYTMGGRSNSGGIEFRLPPDVPQTMSGVKDWFAQHPTTLVYELATPTTETADAYQSPQKVARTESFTDYKVEQNLRDVAIPVGNVSQYYTAIRTNDVEMTIPQTEEIEMVLEV